MVKPAMYRDTPLYWFMALSVIALATVHFVSRPAMATETMEVTFAGTCCAGSECPIATAVGADSGLSHRYSGSETTVTLQTPKGASPRQIWEAVEKTQRKPLRLISGDRRFISKPVR